MNTDPHRQLDWQPKDMLLLIKLLKITPENGWLDGHSTSLTNEDKNNIARIQNLTWGTPYARLLISRHNEIPVYLDRVLATSLLLGTFQEILPIVDALPEPQIVVVVDECSGEIDVHTDSLRPVLVHVVMVHEDITELNHSRHARIITGTVQNLIDALIAQGGCKDG